MKIKNIMNIHLATTYKSLKDSRNTTASLYPTTSLSFHCSKCSIQMFCMQANTLHEKFNVECNSINRR